MFLFSFIYNLVKIQLEGSTQRKSSPCYSQWWFCWSLVWWRLCWFLFCWECCSSRRWSCWVWWLCRPSCQCWRRARLCHRTIRTHTTARCTSPWWEWPVLTTATTTQGSLATACRATTTLTARTGAAPVSGGHAGARQLSTTSSLTVISRQSSPSAVLSGEYF